MKQKDIAYIAVAAIVSAILSFIISSQFLASPEDLRTTVELVPSISAEFTDPDEKYFNEQSLNPTRLIDIGGPTNSNPFNSGE